MIKHGNNNGLIRRAVMAGFLALLAGCAVVPKPKPAPPAPRPVEVAPQANVLPTDADRHRIALLVPMTGAYANVGQAIANATTKALLDTNAKNLRITTYDTANGAGPAAAKAIGDGNKLILGPLNAEDVTAVVAVARPAHVPMITFSSDAGVAARDVFVFGQVPGQSVARVIAYARAHGITAIGAIIPAGAYGQRVAAGLSNAARAGNMRLTDIETYERTNTSVVSAIRRVKAKGQVDAILIADGARIATYAAPSANGVRLLGTELWAGESAIAQSKALRGGWFATVSDDRFGTFERSYFSRFGSHPPRVATLGYDAVLLTLNVARGWKDGTLFPTAKLYDRDGFIGIDGVFRFNEFGIAERALEVREVGTGTFVKVSPAPEHFTQNDYRQ
ncbi:penicillin-binding protein activator [Novosphingobium acidiphilum]|uniref:penicillin-binding protein activator n=1 Tax=Novosphingobium acidiphilum TaxID=505248 RepID=UPI0004249EFC|nr:penicillin-binding protein activator [Novosphingobium acidiphilum]